MNWKTNTTEIEMVHGLETMKRLNEEAIEKHQETEQSPSDDRPVWRDIMTACLAVALILTVAATISKTLAFLSFLRQRSDGVQPIAAQPNVDPLYKFGDRVVLLAGFFDGHEGTVIGWDAANCEYTVRVNGQVIFNVSEDLMSRSPLGEHTPLSDPFRDPFETPQPADVQPWRGFDFERKMQELEQPSIAAPL
jgi:transcription antitermination factor NusG